MLSPLARAAVAVAALVAGVGGLFAQPTADPAVTPVQAPNLPRNLDPAPQPADPLLGPAVSDSSPDSLLTDFKLTHTFLPRFGSRGFGIHDTELSARVALSGVTPLGKPLSLELGSAVHAWDGPARDAAGRDPQLPGVVYDAYLDLGWKPRPAEWLFLDVGVTLGVYSDFRTFDADAFRIRGRGLAIVALSEQFQFVGGVLYVNRNETKVVPAGGFLWSPNEATKVQLVFPQPKVARRLGCADGLAWWGYVGGEFGGGTWAFERPGGGGADSVDVNDYRVLLGVEARRGDGWFVRAEAGYVFGREVVVRGGPRVTPTDTMSARVSLVY